LEDARRLSQVQAQFAALCKAHEHFIANNAHLNLGPRRICGVAQIE